MKICILGCGAYGLALASIFNKNKQNVVMWTFSKDEEILLNDKRESDKLLGYKIPNEIKITSSIKRAIKNSNLVVIAVPAFAVDSVASMIGNLVTKDMHILLATKGIENDTCDFLTDVLERYITSNKIAVISGPTFAKDIVLGVPIGLSLATTNVRTKNFIKKVMESDTTKLRDTQDVIGVQICGAIKNVMAIASGMLEGMNVTDSTKALFLTESLNDIKELIDALGGNKKTILSFSGFGDILMTCTSSNSRNFTYGKLIGEDKLEEATNYSKNTTVEGLYTLRSIKELIKRERVKMPIVDLISDIIIGRKSKEDMLKFLIEK